MLLFPNKKIALPLTVLTIFVLIIGLIVFKAKTQEIDTPITNFEECMKAGYPIQESYPRGCNADGQHFTEDIGNAMDKADLITIHTPQPNDVVTSPLEIRGAARGTWFFEATFPVVLVNWDGLIIAEGYAEAVLDPNDPNSTWMTEDFVAYKATLEFEDPSWEEDFSKRGSLILQKSNPSGLPENDALEIPVSFK